MPFMKDFLMKKNGFLPDKCFDMEKAVFEKLNLNEKFLVVKRRGHFLAKRYFRGFEVFLYEYSEFYIEVWKRVGLDFVYWIETVNHKEVLSVYAEQVSLKDLNKE